MRCLFVTMRNEILLINFFYIHWCTFVTVHNRAGAESFFHNRFVHNRAGAESFVQNRFVHNRAGAESCRVQSIRCSIILVHNRYVLDRSCWIGTVQNRAVLDRYHPRWAWVLASSNRIKRMMFQKRLMSIAARYNGYEYDCHISIVLSVFELLATEVIKIARNA